MSAGEHSTRTLVSRLLLAKSRSSVGRQAAIARIPVGVQAKQFVHHLWTLCQKSARFLDMCTIAWKMSPP